MYRLICFDLDDTLWPCMPTIQHAEQSIYDWMQQHQPAITEQYSISGLRDKRKQLLQQQPQLIHDLSEARRVHLKQLADELGLADDWVEEAFQVFYMARQQVNLYDDVLPVLSALREHYTLAALTNGNAHIRHTGLHDYFDFQVSAADVHAAKPDPAMFHQAMAQAGVEPMETLHVGDHPVHDIEGARNAGIDAAWLQREQQPWQHAVPPPRYQFSDLIQLKQWLDSHKAGV